MKRLIISLLGLFFATTLFAVPWGFGVKLYYDISAGSTLTQQSKETYGYEGITKYAQGDGIGIHASLGLLTFSKQSISLQGEFQLHINNGLYFDGFPFVDNSMEIPLLLTYVFTAKEKARIGIGIGPCASYQFSHNTFNFASMADVILGAKQGPGFINLNFRFIYDLTNNGIYNRAAVYIGAGYEVLF